MKFLRTRIEPTPFKRAIEAARWFTTALLLLHSLTFTRQLTVYYTTVTRNLSRESFCSRQKVKRPGAGTLYFSPQIHIHKDAKIYYCTTELLLLHSFVILYQHNSLTSIQYRDIQKLLTDFYYQSKRFTRCHAMAFTSDGPFFLCPSHDIAHHSQAQGFDHLKLQPSLFLLILSR